MAENCGTRHLKLAGWIAGVVITVCSAITAATAKYYSSDVTSLSERVRQSEQVQAGQSAKLDAILRGQERLEGKMDRHLEEKGKP